MDLKHGHGPEIRVLAFNAMTAQGSPTSSELPDRRHEDLQCVLTIRRRMLLLGAAYPRMVF